MFLGHISSPVLAWFSFRNYGFSDGADLFVFISGYTSALVFTRKMLERGFVFGTTRLFRRAWQIYVAHVLLFVFYLASVHFLSDRFNTPDFIDRFNVAPLLAAPVETLTQGLMLRYKPLNLDVLPLYVVLMGVFPPVLWLMHRHRNLVMPGSVRSISSPGNSAGTCPPGHPGFGISTPSRGSFCSCWAHGWRWAEQIRCTSWSAPGPFSVFGLIYLAFAAAMTLAGHLPELQGIFPRVVFEAFNPNDKTNLAPYRSCIWRSWSSSARG